MGNSGSKVVRRPSCFESWSRKASFGSFRRLLADRVGGGMGDGVKKDPLPAVKKPISPNRIPAPWRPNQNLPRFRPEIRLRLAGKKANGRLG
jgi:hypothetical protein